MFEIAIIDDLGSVAFDTASEEVGSIVSFGRSVIALHYITYWSSVQTNEEGLRQCTQY